MDLATPGAVSASVLARCLLLLATSSTTKVLQRWCDLCIAITRSVFRFLKVRGTKICSQLDSPKNIDFLFSVAPYIGRTSEDIAWMLDATEEQNVRM